MMTPIGSKAPPTIDVACVAVLTLLGCYTHVDAITPRGVPAWAFVYGGLLISIALIGALYGPVRKSSAPGLAIIGLLILTALGMVAAFQQRLFYVNYFVSDIAKVLAPVVFWWVGERHPQLFQSEWSIRYLFWWMMSAAVCAPIYAWLFAPYADYFEVVTSDRGRYDPPHPVLIAILWYYVLHRPTLVSYLLIAVAGGLAFLSQQRTNALLVPLVGIVSVSLEWQHISAAAKRLLFWSSVGLVLCTTAIATLLPVVAPVYRDTVADVLFYTRFDRFEGGLDDSSSNRLLEIKDVIEDLKDAGPLACVLGMGHGGTYMPRESDPEANTTTEGVVHHIHIGPQQVVFRYGLSGLLMMGTCGILGLFRWLQARRPGTNLGGSQRVWLLALFGTAVTFVVFGALHDPFFSAALAALFLAPVGRAEAGTTVRPPIPSHLHTPRLAPDQ